MTSWTLDRSKCPDRFITVPIANMRQFTNWQKSLLNCSPHCTEIKHDNNGWVSTLALCHLGMNLDCKIKRMHTKFNSHVNFAQSNVCCLCLCNFLLYSCIHLYSLHRRAYYTFIQIYRLQPPIFSFLVTSKWAGLRHLKTWYNISNSCNL